MSHFPYEGKRPKAGSIRMIGTTSDYAEMYINQYPSLTEQHCWHQFDEEEEEGMLQNFSFPFGNYPGEQTHTYFWHQKDIDMRFPKVNGEDAESGKSGDVEVAKPCMTCAAVKRLIDRQLESA